LPGKRVCDHALRMSDVWKMTESNRRLLLRTRKGRKEKHSNYCCDLCFHIVLDSPLPFIPLVSIFGLLPR
jgi:hypothetical protein